MKNILKILAVLTLASITMFGGSVKSQDMTRNLHRISSSSIIREADNGYRLCYNYNGISEFIKVGDTNTLSDCLVFEDRTILILDFEVFNDTVYFCGSQGNNAIMGYFKLSSFPYCTVNYTVPVPNELCSLNKLEVFKTGNDVHVVMTADVNTNQQRIYNTLVDAIKIPGGNWQFLIMDEADSIYAFDDVEVTDNFVMFSGRGCRYGSSVPSHTEVWAFQKPTSTGSIFTYYPTRSRLEIIPESPVLIDKKQIDTVAIAENSDNITIVTSLFDATNYIGSCNISFVEPVSARYVKDIKGSKENDSFEILTGGFKEDVFSSLILSVPINSYTSTWSINYRKLDNYEVQSLTYLTANPLHFAASGHKNTSVLHIFKYEQPSYGNCYPVYEITTYDKEYEIEQKSIKQGEDPYYVEPKVAETHLEKVQTDTTCE